MTNLRSRRQSSENNNGSDSPIDGNGQAETTPKKKTRSTPSKADSSGKVSPTAVADIEPSTKGPFKLESYETAVLEKLAIAYGLPNDLSRVELLAQLVINHHIYMLTYAYMLPL